MYSISDTVAHSELLKKESVIWKEIFRKLCSASTSPDSQARHSALQIFSDLIYNYGDQFDEELWHFVLYDQFFRLFDDVMEIYLNLRLQKGVEGEMSSPEAIQTLKSNFENQKIIKEKGNVERMVNHHSGEKLDVLWEETFQIVIRSFAKIAKKYLVKFGNKEEEGESQVISKKIFDSLFFTLRLTEREIFNEAIKALKVILSSDSEGLVRHKKELLGIMEQIPKYLSRDISEAELTKVKQNVVCEVYSMLESFMESSRMFKDETMTEVFFNIFYRLVFLPSIGYVDRFKIFLEERFISPLIKKMPEALQNNGKLFTDNYSRFVSKVLQTKIDNPMKNVIICNMIAKFSDVFSNNRQVGGGFSNEIYETGLNVYDLFEKVRDEDYVRLVKKSKNYKELIWYSSMNCFYQFISATFQDGVLSAHSVTELLHKFIGMAEKIRKEKIDNFEIIKQDCLKEFALFLTMIPKTLQKMVIQASQMNEKPQEEELLKATEEIQRLEDYLQTEVFSMYSFDQESTNLLARYCKTLLQENHRIMAAICSDNTKAAEAYVQLINRYNQTFADYLKQTVKPHSKADE